MCQQSGFREISWLAATVRTGKKGVYFLHEPSALAFQTLGATSVAVLAFSQSGQSVLTGTASVPPEDDEDEEGDEVLSLCSCLYGVIEQLQKQMETLTHTRDSLSSLQRPLGLFKARLWTCMICVHMCMSTGQAWC